MLAALSAVRVWTSPLEVLHMQLLIGRWHSMKLLLDASHRLTVLILNRRGVDDERSLTIIDTVIDLSNVQAIVSGSRGAGARVLGGATGGSLRACGSLLTCLGRILTAREATLVGLHGSRSVHQELICGCGALVLGVCHGY